MIRRYCLASQVVRSTHAVVSCHNEFVLLMLGNFTESDLGDPVMEVVLEPGDLLYFPRGFIHQV